MDTESRATTTGKLGDVDCTVAHTSRIYNYLLGGTTNFQVDREVAAAAFQSYPGGLEGVRADARANRAFQGRVVRDLAAVLGVRQFLDVGAGIPTTGNTHEVAQRVAPDCRVVYIDNDPIVLAHAHDLVTDDGTTAFIHGDLLDVDRLLDHASRTLDLTEPVAVVLAGVLHVVPDDLAPQRAVEALMGSLAPSSYLAVSQMTTDLMPDSDLGAVQEHLDRTMRSSNPPALRSADDVAEFFTGLELLEPGLVPLTKWRPPRGPGKPRLTTLIGGVGRKPG